MDFFGLMKQLFIRPDLFFKNNLKSDLLDTTFGIVAIILFVLFAGIDRTERSIVKLLGKEEYVPVFSAISQDWFYYWVTVLIAGAFAGGIIYLVGGWFYGVRIWFSKGEFAGKKHKNIYLYSFFFMGLTSFILTALSSMLYASPIDTYLSENFALPVIEEALSYAAIIAIYHSLYISYKGAMLHEGISKVRAIIWFIVIPAILYSVALFFVLLAMIQIL